MATLIRESVDTTCNAKGTRMPNRMIRESARTSETLDELSDGAERMFWRLTTVADDFGRFESDPRVLLAGCFPLRVGRLKVEQIARWLLELVLAGLVATYENEGKRYGCFLTWNKHQRVRAQHSKYPPPQPADIRGQMSADGGHRRANAPVVEVEVTEEPEEPEKRETPPLPPPVGRAPDDAAEIIKFLNRKSGFNYQPVQSNLKLVRALLRGGATVDQIHAVIAVKCRQWRGDAKMSRYLRPLTLFNAQKFAQYQGELPATAFSEEQGGSDA